MVILFITSFNPILVLFEHATKEVLAGGISKLFQSYLSLIRAYSHSSGLRPAKRAFNPILVLFELSIRKSKPIFSLALSILS